MRHQRKGRAFGLTDNKRVALIKSLVRSLVLHEKVITTEAKAKEIRPIVEKLVTKSKKDTVSSRRLVTQRVGSIRTTSKMFKEIAPRYNERAGGYLRITKLSPRIKDGARMAVIEFV